MVCRASTRTARMDRCFSAWLLASCLNSFPGRLQSSEGAGAGQMFALGNVILSGSTEAAQRTFPLPIHVTASSNLPRHRGGFSPHRCAYIELKQMAEVPLRHCSVASRYTFISLLAYIFFLIKKVLIVEEINNETQKLLPSGGGLQFKSQTPPPQLGQTKD